MGVDKLTKLILLEWKKLNQQQVMIELIIYWLILFFMPTFFIKVAMPVFGQSYNAAIELNWFIQMGMVLLGTSLINHVFILEYKSKTISLSFGYPISRKKLFTAKVLFIFLFIFLSTVISFLFSGLITYMLDQVFAIINGQPTSADIAKFFSSMMIRAFVISIISFVPLFFFGIWKRAIIPTMICAMIAMQSPNFSTFINIKPDIFITVLTILGALSIYLSIKYADRVGGI